MKSINDPGNIFHGKMAMVSVAVFMMLMLMVRLLSIYGFFLMHMMMWVLMFVFMMFLIRMVVMSVKMSVAMYTVSIVSIVLFTGQVQAFLFLAIYHDFHVSAGDPAFHRFLSLNADSRDSCLIQFFKKFFSVRNQLQKGPHKHISRCSHLTVYIQSLHSFLFPSR